MVMNTGLLCKEKPGHVAQWKLHFGIASKLFQMGRCATGRSRNARYRAAGLLGRTKGPAKRSGFKLGLSYKIRVTIATTIDLSMSVPRPRFDNGR